MFTWRRPASEVENYTKGEVKELEDKVDLDFHDNVVHMKVAAGSKIKNLMTYALKKMKDPNIKQITWNGSGPGSTKTITCAEIMKRKIKGLHQITNIRFKRVEEYWEPKIEGLERLKVNRDIPAITILLSKDQLDSSVPGYQPPGSFDAFWKKGIQEENEADKEGKGRRRHPKASTAAAGAESKVYGDLVKKKKRKGNRDTTAKTKRDKTSSTTDNQTESTQNPSLPKDFEMTTDS